MFDLLLNFSMIYSSLLFQKPNLLFSNKLEAIKKTLVVCVHVLTLSQYFNAGFIIKQKFL